MSGNSHPVRTANGADQTTPRSRHPSERPAGTNRDAASESTTGEKTESVDAGADCPECSGTTVVDDVHGETVCEECGLVVDDEEVDRGPEWRAYDSAERNKKSRVGSPQTETLHDKGLSSMIDWKNEDAYGNSLSAKKRQQMQRLRTWDERFRAQSAQDRNLKQALGEVSRMAAALGLPDAVEETASVIYRRAVNEDLLPGRSIEAMSTASLYAAARDANVPRTLDEFAIVSRVERREFARAYRYLAAELDLTIEPADPEQYVPRIASNLDLPETVRARAVELLEAGKREAVHSGKSPMGLAAAAVYAAAKLHNEDVTQHDVGDVAEVSAVTIRNRYRELLDADSDTET